MQLLNPNTLFITALATASLAGAAPVDVPGPIIGHGHGHGPIIGHSHGSDQAQQSRQLVAPAVSTPNPVPHGAGPRCGIQPVKAAETSLSKRDPSGIALDNADAAAFAAAAIAAVEAKKPNDGSDKKLQRRGGGGDDDKVDGHDFAITMSAEDFAQLAGFFNRAKAQQRPHKRGDDGKKADGTDFVLTMSAEDYDQLAGSFSRAQVHKRDVDAEPLQRRGNIFKDAWEGFTQKHNGYPPFPAGTTNRHDAVPMPFYNHKPGWFKEELAKTAQAKADAKEASKHYGNGMLAPPGIVVPPALSDD